MGKLDGKIALVTGGNSGIDLAPAKQFAGEGAHVFITGRRDPELAAAVKEIGGNVTTVRGDVSKLGDLDRLFAQIHVFEGCYDEARLGKVSNAVPQGLINALGIPTDDFFQIIHVLPPPQFGHTGAFRGLVSFGRGLAQRAHISDKEQVAS